MKTRYTFFRHKIIYSTTFNCGSFYTTNASKRFSPSIYKVNKVKEKRFKTFVASGPQSKQVNTFLLLL